jgi:CheY-like chemotaxis protein
LQFAEPRDSTDPAALFHPSAGPPQAVASRPDLALVDIGLPLLDGYAVARQVRAALGRDVRLVAVTGCGQVQDVRRALAAGFDAHLTKPAEQEELLQVMAAGR